MTKTEKHADDKKPRAERRNSEDDCTQIGGDRRGLPNRAYLAGMTGDESYLVAQGARDPNDAGPIEPAGNLNPKEWDF